MPRKRLGVESMEGDEENGIGAAEAMVVVVCGRNGSRDAEISSRNQQDERNLGKVRKVAAAVRVDRCCGPCRCR